MTVMTLNLVEKQPATMRRIIGKHLAVPRWQETCDYYNQMMERERLTVCFHAQWICPYISRHLLSLNPLLACCRRYSRGER